MALSCYQTAPGYEVRGLLAPPAVRAAAAPLPMDVLWHPDATRKPLPGDVGGTLTRSAGLVLHVQAGDNSPWGWFNRPDVKASSHWWVAKSGALEQYVAADRVAWAQAGGNAAWHSVETEGFPGEGLSVAQIATLGRIYRWGHDRWGWPLHLAESPTGTGLGWHGMGGAAWGGHVGCPGEIRKGQRSAILAAAIGGQSKPEPEDDMPTPAEIAAAVWTAPPPPDSEVDRHINKPNMRAILGEAYNKTGAIQKPGLADIAAQLDRIERGLSAAAPAAATAMATPAPAPTADDLIALAPSMSQLDAVRITAAYAARAASLQTATPKETP